MSLRAMLRFWLRGLEAVRRDLRTISETRKALTAEAETPIWRPVRASWLLAGPSVEPDRSRHRRPNVGTAARTVVWLRHEYPEGWWHADPWDVLDVAERLLAQRERVEREGVAN